MHVGVSGRTFTMNEPGGAVRVGMQHAGRLPEYVGETTVFGHDSLRSTSPPYEVKATGHFHPSLLFGMLWEQTMLPFVGSRIGIDVGFFPNTICPLKETDFPVVSMIHGVPGFRGFGSNRYIAFRKWLLPRVASRADHVVTVSEFSKRELCEHLPVSSDYVSVVYNGLDERFLDDGSANASLDLPEPYLLYVGAKSERKNFTGVLRAFERFIQEYDTGHSLVVIGPSTNATYDVLDKSALASTVVESIYQPGYVTDEELKYAYEDADAFLFPTRYEGFGLPPLEAAACNTPVVSSKTGAIPEVLGSAAEHVDPDDPTDIARGIWQSLKNPDTGQTEIARENARQFTWGRASNRLVSVLEDVHQGWEAY
jgi:glycosyltransferase involved in cell wall biosynthesis